MSVPNEQAPQGTPNAPAENDPNAKPDVSMEDTLYAKPEDAAKPKEGEKPAEPAPKADAPSDKKPDEKTGDESKPDDDDKPDDKEKVDTKYELTLPKDSLLTTEQLDKISSFAKEKGLSKEQAESLLERESNALTGMFEAHEQRVEGWKTQAEKDKEIGGEKFKQNVELSHRVIERYGSQALKDELSKSGYGNHPELVRLLSRIGKSMSEDQLILPGSKTSNAQKPIEDIFYGNSNQ